MSEITYLVGDATQPVGEGAKFLPHICNDQGGWGAGYVMALSRRWKEPEANYRRWYKTNSNPLDGDPAFKLGNLQYVSLPDDVCVINMIAQAGYGEDGKPPIRYDALERCLNQLAQAAMMHDASVHMPRIGCGLAGGKWEKVEELINKCLIEQDIPVYVYDLK